MYNLRLLIINGVDIPNVLDYLSNNLRYLDWKDYSSKCLPSSFQPEKLVVLALRWSKIEYLWEGIKVISSFNCFSIIYYFSLQEVLQCTPIVFALSISWGPWSRRTHNILPHIFELHPFINNLLFEKYLPIKLKFYIYWKLIIPFFSLLL